MIGPRFALLTALVPLMGGWVAAFASVRAVPRALRLAAFLATGLVTITVEMGLLASLGIPWSAALLLPLPLLATLFVWWRTRGQVAPAVSPPRERAVLILAAAAILAVAATVFAGAATSFDLLLFWGVKGQRFGLTHTIDVAFLRDPAHKLMHSDYPPLVPLVYAWTMLGSEQLDWFGTIATAPLLLLAGSAAVWGFTRSGTLTALYATTFGFVFLDNNIAGNAEPMLLFLETVVLAALLADCDALAAIALPGVVLTKVEGAAFVGAILVWKIAARAAARLLPAATTRSRSEATKQDPFSFSPPQREEGGRTPDEGPSASRWLAVLLPPLLALTAWIAFCAHHGLLDTYRSHGSGGHSACAAVFRPLLIESSMHAFYLPWIALAVLIAAGRTRAALPGLAAAAAYLAFLIVVWAGGAEANIAKEIAWSARRVLITPLLLVFFAAAGAASFQKTYPRD